MSNDLPAPLVTAEVDLRDFKDFPLDFKRLFASDTWIECDAEEKVAALRLWCFSMHQEPAGSLPNNDRILADLAGYGVAIKEFLKIKPNAMRGWIVCNDGRLYHPVVAEKMINAWGKKRRKESDNAADRERKRRKKETSSGRNGPPVPPEKPDIPPYHSAGIPAGNRLKEKRMEGEESPDSSLRSESATPAAPTSQGDLLDIPLWMLKPPDGDWSKLLFRQGLQWLASVYGKPPNAMRAFLGDCLKRAGDDHRRVFLILAEAQRDAKADPKAWLVRVLSGKERSSVDAPANAEYDANLKAWSDACDAALRNGTKPGDPDWPKREDFGLPPKSAAA